MRVAFFVNEFPKISETFILDQITFLLDHGCAVDIFAQELHRGAITHDDVLAYDLLRDAELLVQPGSRNKVLRLARGLFDLARALPQNPRLVLRSLDVRRFGARALKFEPFYRSRPFLSGPAYDIVHCHFGPIGTVGAELRALGAFKAPLLTQFHGFDASSYLRVRGEDIYRELFREADVLLCVSERIEKRLRDMGCEARKTRVHHTGVKVAATPFSTRTPASTRPIEVLTVGRLVEKKGIEFGLRAIARLAADCPQLRYTIVGDGPEEARLRALSRELGLGERVTFAGALPRDQVSQLMQRAQVLLAPSVVAQNGDEEGIPVVLMEAMACGLPVVSSEHAGIPELIKDSISGLLAPERDVEALVAQLKLLLAEPNLARELALAAREVIERDYDVERLNADLLSLYQNLRADFAHRSR
ncbi:MAG TPA: glycosyltransferase [Polyangiaceae bacterium]|jgi:colanic acid/amylovoran biosynthesis glycosyltransferase